MVSALRYTSIAASITGISVVQSGVLNLSGSDITGNGHEHGKEQQIMIEDLHDVRDQVRQNGIVNIRGDLMEGPLANNYVSRKSCKSSEIHKGGLSERFPILSTKDVTTTCTKIIYCLFSRGLGNLERIPHRFSLIITKYCVEVKQNIGN
eukprot:scaffold233625_cov40-Cyclotella_meneghiniana.AAC.1